MCGILGALPSVDLYKFKVALSTLAHRGPDGYGIWESSSHSIILGHRRLSIIDLTDNGKQPMSWQDRYVITFNGEIYNYIELRIELQKKGVQFKTKSDTEVLLALYAEEGSACLHKLNGMWSFAIFDMQENVLFLSRDRMGKKPLFYIQNGNQFVFASEMKALYPFLDKVEPNLETINMAKADMFSYEATSNCLIKGINRFPKASYGIYKNGQLRTSCFWKPLENLIAVPNRYNDQVEFFKELFIDACKIRMRSDVPIGTALSGGIDSSATISTMAYVAKNLEGEYSRDWQHAFVASFPGSFLDETSEAMKVTQKVGINATYVNIDPLKDIDKLFYYSYLFEEFYITAPIPFIQLYAKIKQSGITVTLDGHGADELFAGYFFDLQPKIYDDYPYPFRIKKTLQTIENSLNSNITISNGRVFLEYKELMKKSVAGYSKKSNLKRHSGLDNLNWQLYKSTFETILPTLLRNYDRYSMINGVEIRMPFLDHRIVSFAFSIPSSSKVRNGYTKAILRDAMKGFFPDEIRLLKRKIGFNSPMVEWIKGPLKEWLLDEMSGREFNSASLIDPSIIKQNLINIMENTAATEIDAGQAWNSFMPYVWEKSLKYATRS
jgi:asparagine synthase (glutamine-hydrolysing)